MHQLHKRLFETPHLMQACSNRVCILLCFLNSMCNLLSAYMHQFKRKISSLLQNCLVIGIVQTQSVIKSTLFASAFGYVNKTGQALSLQQCQWMQVEACKDIFSAKLSTSATNSQKSQQQGFSLKPMCNSCAQTLHAPHLKHRLGNMFSSRCLVIFCTCGQLLN